MKKYYYLIIGILAFATIASVGCGNTVPMDVYNQAIADKDRIATEKDDALADFQNLMEEKRELEDNYNQLQSNMDEAKIKLSEAQDEIYDLENKYPPRRFKDVLELENWLNSQTLSPRSSDAIIWFQHGLQLQEAALNDGFIINVELSSDDEVYYTVTCTAVLQDDSFYWWEPESYDIYYWLNVRQF